MRIQLSRARGVMALVSALVAAGLGAPGCSDPGGGASGPPACLDAPAEATCSPAAYGLRSDGTIAPTFHDVYSNTLRPVCAQAGCHAGPSPQKGLAMDDEATAYANLVTGGRVTAGDLKCGKAFVRLESGGESWSMPPGNPLDEPTLCAIRHWIAAGAKP